MVTWLILVEKVILPTVELWVILINNRIMCSEKYYKLVVSLLL